MTQTQECIPMWFYRSNGNIEGSETSNGISDSLGNQVSIEDEPMKFPLTTKLRHIFTPFHDWKTQTHDAKNNQLTVTCFICNNEETFTTCITGSYPLCNICQTF